MESETVKSLDLTNSIDRSYYDEMVDAAVHDISAFGDFEWFVSDDESGTPPWQAAEEPWKTADEGNLFNVR